MLKTAISSEWRIGSVIEFGGITQVVLLDKNDRVRHLDEEKYACACNSDQQMECTVDGQLVTTWSGPALLEEYGDSSCIIT